MRCWWFRIVSSVYQSARTHNSKYKFVNKQSNVQQWLYAYSQPADRDARGEWCTMWLAERMIMMMNPLNRIQMKVIQ